MDLNLLTALHVLLAEEQVTSAAERLHLSVPAASRTLARCRRTFGDPLLVREGRGVTITPRGRELLAMLDDLMPRIAGVFERPEVFEPASLRCEFVVRANEVVIAAIGSSMLDRVRAEAPSVRVRFELEASDDIDAVRAGDVDLAIGSYSDLTSDVDHELVATERMVGVVRSGHAAATRRITAKRFAGLDHVVMSRRGRARGPIDDALAADGLQRTVAAVVPSFSAAIAMCATSDLTTVAPQRLTEVIAGIATYPLPVALPMVEVCTVWHGRNSVDPAHRWLRSCVAATGRTTAH
jgi:DNA-binding transcriptional LysR family regulator